MLGYLNEIKGPVRLKDRVAQPEYAGLQPEHALFETFLGMPICHRDERIGSICLVDKDGGPEFTDEDENIAAMFAARAASIIANARRYEAEHSAKADLETLLDISPMGVIVFDVRGGEVAYMNQELLRLIDTLEMPESSMDNVFEVLSFRRADGREVTYMDLPATRALQIGETVPAEEIVIQAPNGNAITTLLSAAPIFSESGEIVSVVSVVQDMTSLDDLDRKQVEFLAMVSEELRTPLISIKGSAAALKDIVESMVPTEPLQLLRIIDQQTDLMRSQLNSLIELTQFETGKLSVATESTDVAGLIHQSCGGFLRDHSAVTVQLDIPAGLPKILVDKQRMSQVLHNLLRQVANHSNESLPIKVAASKMGIHVAISLSVAGSFDRPADLPREAEHDAPPLLFKQIARSHDKFVDMASQGEGLAYSFCRGVIEAHGGRIGTEVDEQEGRLTMTFTLPSVEDADEIQLSAMPRIASEPMPAPTDKTQILVSIEEPELLRTVRRVLLDAGYGTVETFGLDEIEQLASSERPKLILLDIAGREEASFRALRAAGKPLNLPAIVFCDRDDEEYVVRAFEMGADGYMVKPFSPSELIARIRGTLRRSNAGGKPAGNRTFQLGEVAINFDERTVNVSGQPVQLTATEYKLLTELCNSAGRVLTQDMLLHKVWGPGYSGESQLLRSYIKSLRQKLRDNARKPTYIFTEHGVGYRMARP
ncbi:MAG: winged helix-turn-helix domain-containing protein [Dehalococcoidia bacterium]|nr:winged helix-turn-helix domain-containing protein [Dehalococcoidia bacterium]